MSISRSFQVVCDLCGRVSDGYPTSKEAKMEAKKSGWRADHQHICPTCRAARRKQVDDSPLAD